MDVVFLLVDVPPCLHTFWALQIASFPAANPQPFEDFPAKQLIDSLGVWKGPILFQESKNESLGGGSSNIFMFTPIWGNDPNLTNIFQRGWNHQPVNQLQDFITKKQFRVLSSMAGRLICF